MLRALWGRKRRERELDEELDSYLALAEERHRKLGLDPRAARRAARLELGGKEQVKERVRRAWAGAAVEEVARDLRYALSAWSARPLLTLTMTLTLALGVGVNAAIFSMFHAVLVRPLPYADPDRLALVWFGFSESEQSRNPASGPELDDLRERARSFEELAGIWSSTGALTDPRGSDAADPEQVRVGFVTARFFEVLGTAPALGRDFVAEDEGAGATVSILSDGLWRRRFGADPGILGREVMLDGSPHRVVGILPPGFELRFPPDAGIPTDLQVWVPFPWDLRSMGRGVSFVRVLSRLSEGATLEQAGDELRSLAADLRGEHARYQELGLGLDLVPLQRDATRHLRTPMLAMLGAVSLVLLIACVNVGHLQLGRLASRRREIALRAALGASRGRLARQLVIESVALSLIGGAAGLLLGDATLRLLSSRLPPGLEALGNAEIDSTTIGYAFAVTLLAGIVSGLAPMRAVRSGAASDALRQSGAASGEGGPRLRNLLVVGEVALGTLLLIGAGLMLRTLVATARADLGFRPVDALTFRTSLPRSRYPDDAARAEAAARLRETLASLSGVAAVGASSHLPFDDVPNWYGFVWRDGAGDRERSSLMADQRAITPGYLEALGATLVAGRSFDERDRADQGAVAVVDETLAGQLWPGQSPLGRGLNLEGWIEGGFLERRVEVVGVVRHLRSHDLTSSERGQVYLPHAQNARPLLGWVARPGAADAAAASDPTLLAAPIAARVRELDPDLPLADVRLLGDRVERAAAAARFTTFLCAAFAVVALLLAAIGIYGVIASTVERRTREIGLRIALGARPRQVVAAALGQGLAAAAAGLALGLLGGACLGRFLDGILHGVSATDAATYATVAALSLSVAAAAAFLPARKAAKVNPMLCLRRE